MFFSFRSKIGNVKFKYKKKKWLWSQKAVDVVGQAGRPKTITGFQTHSTPVLLAFTERAELATEEYLPCSSILEGFVILKKNPDWMEDDTDTPGKWKSLK